MTAPSYPIYEGTTGVSPRRPADDCEDFGGLYFTDATGANAPISHEDPSAYDFMQLEQCVQRHAVMLPAMSVDFHFDGMDTYTIEYVRALHRSITPSSGLVELTHMGTGEHMVSWTAGLLPSRNGYSRAILVNSPYGDVARVQASIASSGNSVVVSVLDSSDVPSDAECYLTVDIFGE